MVVDLHLHRGIALHLDDQDILREPSKSRSHAPKQTYHRGYPGVETSADITEPLKKRARLGWMIREPNARSNDLWVLKVEIGRAHV